MPISAPPSSTRGRRIAAALTLSAVTLGLGLTTVAPAEADAPDVGSSTLVPVQVTGDPDERFNLVILGDGYTAAEQDKFYDQVETHLETMWSLEPYKSYRNNMNVYAIGIISGESGVSCDKTLDAPRRDTPLSMAFWSGCSEDGIERLLVMDNDAAADYASQAPKVDQILALANSDTYGGAGGRNATASGGNALSALISPHEIGHSLGGLDDEYDYYSRGESTGDYTGDEPESAHHTLLTPEEMVAQHKKWWRWIGEKSTAGGIIGAYEGGQYHSTGIYRPSLHSMMKTLGYQMDQVSREIMTEAIAGSVPLVPASTPTDEPVALDEVLWVETAHPVYHELDVTWAVNGEPVANPQNLRTLDLETVDVESGDTITATIVDNTEFVRDPAIREKSSMTQERTWTVGNGSAPESDVVPEITEATPTSRAAGLNDVIYVNTSHRDDRTFDVSWSVDGEAVKNDGKANLALEALALEPGSHEVTATVSDPADPDAPTVSESWAVDSTGPRTDVVVSSPIETSTAPNGELHYTVEESFTMKLTGSDDREGALISEFRLNGDGWHHYYGWPTDSDAAFEFTPTGTNIDDLIYGNLGTGGMSLSPFQEREPGYGEHRVEYRTTDAAGNIGPVQAFTVTVVKDGSGGDDGTGGDEGEGDDSGDGDDTSTEPSEPSSAEPSGSLSSTTVKRKGAVRVTGEGFEPDEIVEVWLHSDPVRLASVTADDAGGFSQSVTIPTSTALGAHQMELRGEASGSVTLSLTIVATLASTGADPAAAIGIAAGLLLLGCAVVLAARRQARRRAMRR